MSEEHIKKEIDPADDKVEKEKNSGGILEQNTHRMTCFKRAEERKKKRGTEREREKVRLKRMVADGL